MTYITVSLNLFVSGLFMYVMYGMILNEALLNIYLVTKHLLFSGFIFLQPLAI
jgi:hypothetical protein